MKIAVFGTGNVGETLGSKLIGLGHEVKLGSRTANHEKALSWVKKAGAKASTGTFADAAKEQYLPIWARLYGALKTGNFNIKIVR